MIEWREVVLGDLCERVTVGHVGKMATQYVERGVPFLRSQNVRPFVINRTGMLFIGDDFNAKLRKSALTAGDVVVVRTGYPGTASVIPEDLDGSNCADLVVITPSDRLNPHVLAGLFNSVYGRQTVKSQLVGSAQQHFNVGSAKAMKVRLPDRVEQDRIAEILCSLNDLIENNRRRVEVLEKMARAIYREWFVKFRYPGHEDVPLVDPARGPIPEGWEVRTVRDVSAVVVRGISPKYAEDGEWIVLNQKCIRNDRVSFAQSRRQERSVSDAKRVRFGDILVNSTGVGTLGRVAMYRGPSEGVTVDSHVTICRPVQDHLNPWYAMNMLSKQSEIERMGAGATGQTELRKSDVEALDLVQPLAPVVDAFNKVISPLLEQIDFLLDNSDTVSSLRDLLLPKLVTGQIDISSLDLDALVSTGPTGDIAVA